MSTFSAFRLSLIATCLIVFGLALTLPQQSASQASSGVTGVVTDVSGAVIGGATVTLTNPGTGLTLKATTNSDGVYEFLHVLPATYEIKVGKDKFRSVTVSNVELGVGVVETRNIKLSVGAQSETIEVTASGEGTINTVDSSIGNVITNQQVEDLPSILVDNASAVLQLQPGVQVSGGDSQYGSVTGSRADATNITLDGLDVNDEEGGFAFYVVGRAPIDSISQVRTIVGGADVSFGRSAGAQVDMVTKSGTNHWHGTLYEYNRVSVEAANDYFNNLAGIPRAQLTRNQFGGSIGGPILKDKLFFFFDYAGRRQATGSQQTITVPLDPFRNGELNYINSSGNVVTLPATGAYGTQSVQGLDPCSQAGSGCAASGADQALLSFIASRPYPEPNDFSVGDGVNTAGYLFTAPSYIKANTFVGRLDYNLSSRHNLFARGTWDTDRDTYSAKAFPNDAGPVDYEINHSRSWVFGDAWTINTRMLNQASFGLTRQVLDFPANLSSTANIPIPYEFGFGILSGPYGGIGAQGRNVPVPEIRDTFSWTIKKHTLQFGADIKPIRVHSYLTNNLIFPGIGLQSEITSLDPTLRPSDILATGSNAASAQSLWDNAFTTLLGRYSYSAANYYYDPAGNAAAPYTPANRNYPYNEYEFFVQDSWKMSADLTFSYGLRWNYHSVFYEENGYEAVPNYFEQQLFSSREQAAANGVNGFNALPFITYGLGGPKNHGPNYYHPDWKDFAPRIGLAWSPSFTSGFLGHLFGDRKTSVRAGAGMAYDRVLSTLSFEIDQNSQLFSASYTNEFGVPGNPEQSLLTDPRFTTINSPPAPPPPGTAPRPVTPYVYASDGNNCPVGFNVYGSGAFVPAGQPCATGLYYNEDLFQLNDSVKLPYSISVSFGFQRELPRNFILEVSYFGKFGHRLLASSDPFQQTNFIDPASKQSLNAAFTQVQEALCGQTGPAQPCNLNTGVIGSITAQPWFENQMDAALSSVVGPGAACVDFFGLNCTNLAADVLYPNFSIGDVSTVDVILANAGLLLPNTGLGYQTGSVVNYGNYAASNYHSLITSLRKKFSDNLYFDFDYVYARAIDNVSDVTNDAIFAQSSGTGLICDLTNLRTCRANADFDATHTISANYEYQLPIGRGQRLFGGMPRWADEIVGGWATSGIVAYHSGYPFSTVTNAFPIDFTMLGPAVFIGPRSAVAEHVHFDPTSGGVQLFTNQTNALAAFAHDFGGATGERNQLRGPGFADVDMALLKTFKVREGFDLQFRAEAFNAFNHPSFNNPSNSNIDSAPTYGFISGTSNAPRELSLGLLLRF